MAWWHPHQFEDQKPYLEARMHVIKAVRAFFDDQDFWEVETPILQVCPVMDTHIHAFKTDILGLDLQKERELYLHTSPEFAMKKLMVAGVKDLYQICHVFRNGEGSKLHSPEFTMIEWYRSHAGYEDIMDDCVDLLRTIAKKLDISEYSFNGHTADPFKDWERLSVAGAFEKYADIDLAAALEDRDRLAEAVAEQGIRVTDSDNWDDLFHAVMAEKIEPHLGMGVPTILYDYPASMASLSRRKPDDTRFAERFELYVCGVELANAFGELTDAKEQRTRFIEEMDIKEKLYGERYPIDEEFLEALEYGLPESGGIALGIDRLVMLASGADDIDKVLWTGKP
ncbi:MAG: EF-P lysine aminoacylase GenX [Alphaproteobacteria bacterium]|nr:EF-P lysine aminoacylase GenX [Alphaproteobacteria bacterium]